MSRGNPIVSCRISADVLQEVLTAINRRNAHVPDEPWTFADFVSIAIREKLRKMERSRRRRDTAALPKGKVYMGTCHNCGCPVADEVTGSVWYNGEEQSAVCYRCQGEEVTPDPNTISDYR